MQHSHTMHMHMQPGVYSSMLITAARAAACKRTLGAPTTTPKAEKVSYSSCGEERTNRQGERTPRIGMQVTAA